MTRTLVISDLHLGARADQCVLRSAPFLDRLVTTLSGFDRLVLLGDVLELAESTPFTEVITIAAPVLTRLGESVSEIVMVPGNHDRPLISPWLEDQGENLRLEAVVPADASPWLAETVGLLSAGGAHVSVRYPGYRLSERVWMTHGHYLDRLLIPQGPYGLVRRRRAAHHPHEYERLARASRRPRAVRVANDYLLEPRFAHVTGGLLNLQMRHHSLPALATAVGALGVASEYVVFGHVHRLGPITGDRTRAWRRALHRGATPTQFVNTGSWQYEPLLIGNRRAPHPYSPGGSVIIDEDGIPHAVGLLDGLDPRTGYLPQLPTR